MTIRCIAGLTPFAFALCCVAVIGATSGSAFADTPASRRPNLLLIIADDLGYSDLGSYGSEIRTPNIDALAQRGVRFTDFHAHALCTPSRTHLLTGVDNHLAGFGNMRGDLAPEQKGQPGYEAVLNDRVVTIAELLRDAGYLTIMSGKWDLGPTFEAGPDQRGFEESFVLMQGAASHFDALPALEEVPAVFYRENGRPVALPADFYSSSSYTNHMLDMLRRHAGESRPFFGVLAFTAPHWPLQAPDEYLQRQTGSYREGYEPIRQQRLQRMRAMEIIPNDLRAAPPVDFLPSWDDLSPTMRDLEARRMQVYAAMIEALDHEVGRLVDGLRASGQLDHTFILFLSDNGAEGGNVMDWGQYPWAERIFDLRPENMGRRGSYVWLGPGWAQVSSMPWRLMKGFPTNGGLLVPAIAVLPGDGARGAIARARVTALDVVPTMLELAGVRHPGAEYRGRRVFPLEGRSFSNVLRHPERQIHDDAEMLGFEIWNRRAVIQGDWKIEWMNAPWGRGNGQWSLFNLAHDPTELVDLADTQPEKLAGMIKLWREYVAKHGVIEVDHYDVPVTNRFTHYEWLPPSLRGTPPGSYNIVPWEWPTPTQPARQASGVRLQDVDH